MVDLHIETTTPRIRERRPMKTISTDPQQRLQEPDKPSVGMPASSSRRRWMKYPD